jgi:cytoskeleton protein RodZ
VRHVTFLQRIRTPFAEDAAYEMARPRLRQVGEFLQERREDLGLDLDEIGAMLKIKPGYLIALEQGRSHDLPGAVYAIGFVRAYADFLGLDAEQVLARFKSESTGIALRQDLTLPMALGERSLPGGALVLVALIVALCGYGVWYYLSTADRDRPERVAVVPAALRPSLVPPPAGPALANDTTVPAVNSASAAPAAPSVIGAVANPVPSTSTGSVSPNAVPAKPATTGTSPTPDQGNPAAASPSPRLASAPATAAPTQSVAVPPPVSQTAAVPVTSSSAADAAGRIAIRAVSDCWIQVRAADQSIVFSRVLKAGEVYKVPPRAGLSLRTGNAGALEITVDGKPAPAIGGLGALRRDVVLDPAALNAGTAVHG